MYLRINFLFRPSNREHTFVLSNGAEFTQKVIVNSTVSQPEWRFGIDKGQIDKFIENLMDVEVEGRKFRTKYQIKMASGPPQAENFLWTILGNKVTVGRRISAMSKIVFFKYYFIGDQRGWTEISSL